MRFIPALLPLLLALGACSLPEDTTVTGRVLDVQGSDLSIEIDGKKQRMRLAGVIPPEPGDCVHDEFTKMVRYMHAPDYQDVEVATVGKAPDGVPLVTVTVDNVDETESDDLATLLVGDGVVVIDALEVDVKPGMAAARDAAYEDRAGFFKDYEDCTFAGMFSDVEDEYEDIADFVPDDTDGADIIIDDIAAWILVADALLDSARRGAHDLRLLAYPPKVLAQMIGTVTTHRAAAQATLKEARTLRKTLAAKEARQAAIDKAENDRWWAEYNAEHRSSSGGGSSSSSGGGNSGYTGPRCYAPGGKTWRPC